MKWAIERDHVTDLEQAFDILMECDVQFLFNIGSVSPGIRISGL
jgi:hypothetical protein